MTSQLCRLSLRRISMGRRKRTRLRARRGTSALPSEQVAKQQEEGETAELLMPDGSQYPGKLSDTNRKIEEIVGLTADQFRKVVMIAQGEFMDFLRAGSKEKTELLRDLLKTDYYYQLSERLKTLAKEKNTAAKTQRANMSFLRGER